MDDEWAASDHPQRSQLKAVADTMMQCKACGLEKLLHWLAMHQELTPLTSPDSLQPAQITEKASACGTFGMRSRAFSSTRKCRLTSLSKRLSLDDSALPCCSKPKWCTSDDRLSRTWGSTGSSCRGYCRVSRFHCCFSCQGTSECRCYAGKKDGHCCQPL